MIELSLDNSKFGTRDNTRVIFYLVVVLHDRSNVC